MAVRKILDFLLRKEKKEKHMRNSFRHMSVEEKQPFLDMAETLKRQHHIDHPDYKFKPKQRSSNANKTTTTKKNSSFTRLF
jgi:hypothetical protein